MSGYSELNVGSFFVGSEMDDLIPPIMTLYLESDKRIEMINPSDLKLNRDYPIDEFEKDEKLTQIQYVCSVSVAIDRLELMGYTRKVAKKGFDKALHAEIARIEVLAKEEGILKDRLEVLKDLTFEKWLKNLKVVVRKDLKRRRFGDPECSEYPPILRYMLCDVRDISFGFPGYDYRHFLRILLDLFKPDEELVYDITGLAIVNYYENIKGLIEYADSLTSWNQAYPGKIIVLTEGITDKKVLERSLSLLYPHLANYFSFLDFEGVRIGGGSGELVKIVKAFIGAGIINRIVAFFDNDTAASIAIEALSGIKLPKNIAILKYPDMKFAENYPTIGPSGVVKMDVNGLAGSIEIYFGEDVLKDNDGNLIPIQWKGYEPKLKRYQGEILKEDELKKKFFQKIKICERDHGKISNYDWSGISIVLDTLLSAFREHDAEEILKDEILY